MELKRPVADSRWYRLGLPTHMKCSYLRPRIKNPTAILLRHASTLTQRTYMDEKILLRKDFSLKYTGILGKWTYKSKSRRIP